MLRRPSHRENHRHVVIAAVVVGVVAAVIWQSSIRTDNPVPQPMLIVVDAPRPAPSAIGEEEAAFDRILVSMPLDRVAELLRSDSGSSAGDAVPGWSEIPREDCNGFRRIFVPHPRNYSARTLARTCDLNPEDVPLTLEQMAELEELLACFLPPFEEADALLVKVRGAEQDAALAVGNVRRMGDLSSATAEERGRVDRSVESMMPDAIKNAVAMGLPYNEEWIRRTLREPWARRLDPDQSMRLAITRVKDGDAHIISIDAMPRSKLIWDLKLHISHTFGRSIVTWFEHRGFLDATRAAPVWAELDRVYRRARRQLGLE
jgi:hypothetical protein